MNVKKLLFLMLSSASLLLNSCDKDGIDPQKVEWVKLADYPISGLVDVQIDPIAGIAYAMPWNPEPGTVDVYSMDLEENFWVKSFSYEVEELQIVNKLVKSDFGGIYLFTSGYQIASSLRKLKHNEGADIVAENIPFTAGFDPEDIRFNSRGDFIWGSYIYSSSEDVFKEVNGEVGDRFPVIINDEFYLGGRNEFVKVNMETMEMEQLYYAGGPERFERGDFRSFGYYGNSNTVFTLGNSKVIHWDGTTPTQYPFKWEPYEPWTRYSTVRAGDRLFLMMYQGNSFTNLEEIFVLEPNDSGYKLVKITDEEEGLGSDALIGLLLVGKGKLYANFHRSSSVTGGASQSLPLYRVDF